MLQIDVGLGKEQMDYGAWCASLRAHCGRHNLVDLDPHSFSGWLRTLSGCGFTAVAICCNAHRLERTHRDVRLDDLDHYEAVFQVAGHSTIYQNDQCARLSVGDVALVDWSRPMMCVSDDALVQRLSLHLPRQSLVSHRSLRSAGSRCKQRGARPLR